jgi:Ca2+-binding RTX toxin-like protein
MGSRGPQSGLVRPPRWSAFLASCAAAIGALVFVGTTPAFAETCDGIIAHIIGSNMGETIYGTYGDDVIQAKDGNDTVYPVNGDDLACGGDGQDTIDESGYSGVDHLVGGYGGDFLYDNVNASTGGTLNGNSGGDVLEGTDGGNNLYGGPGDNFIYAEEGADNVYGGDDADVINASNGNDTVYAGDANDTVLDGYGSDFLRGEGGSGDILRRCDNLNDFAGFETVYGPNSAYC